MYIENGIKLLYHRTRLRQQKNIMEFKAERPDSFSAFFYRRNPVHRSSKGGIRMDILQYFTEHEEELISLRRFFHRIPETGYEEIQTSGKIADFLQELGLTPRIVTKTGVVALINEDSPGPLILIRSDIDALDVSEETNLPYASQHPGKMHACGHDGHMACMLMVAKYLSSHSEELPGKVLMLFQPNEERAGALNMIKEGVLRDYPVKACVGMHVWPELETGKFGITEGVVMAGCNHFHIHIEGTGGHTGNPHKAVDPVLCAAAIIQGAQAIQTREIDAQKPTILMFGKMESGSLSNVIPDTADLYGTIRYLYEMTEEEDVKRRLENFVEHISAAYRTKAVVIWEENDLCLCNDKKMTELAKEAAGKVMGSSDSVVTIRSTVSEDFSEFSSRVPGVFCHVGVGNRQKDTCYPLHSPKFNMDESALKYGAALMVQIAIDWMKSWQ